MSAPSLMCRVRLFVLLVLAFALATGAHAASDIPVGSHGKTAETHAPHRYRRARARRAGTAGRSVRHERAETRPARRSSHARQSASRVRLRRHTRHELAARSHRAIESRHHRVAAASYRRSEDRAVPAGPAIVPAAEEITAGEEHPSVGFSRHFTRRTLLRIARGGMPPPLRGSLELLERQDTRLAADGLERIDTEQALSDRIAKHLLVQIPVSDGLSVDERLTPNHRYCRPWTAQFLADLARAHEAEFHRPIEVTSAVRPVSYQAHLTRINGNAAPAEGDIVSPHVMGATVDIGKKGMSWREISWMRRQLLDLEEAGKIDVEEEFHQSCFHITVYRDYLPVRPGVHTTEADEGVPKNLPKPTAVPVALGAGPSAGGQ